MICLNGVKVEPTIFPDKTSQVWKLKNINNVRNNVITWEFENEGEFMHVAQLFSLCRSYFNNVTLELPYLPYGRQDKPVSNETTFALSTFLELLQVLNPDVITTIDAHSDLIVKDLGAFNRFPREEIQNAIDATKAHVLAFPDEGASRRYKHRLKMNSIDGIKERDPLTGELAYKGFTGKVFESDTILIVDDICDGGATFCMFARLLREAGAKTIHLYTTHGIYSKGIQILRNAGIQRIFNRKGEVK